uniref:Uncharacterized protein n=1 Tax=Arundo donax TaxID=35708 RepID=A0A0A8ZUA7_ARUDO
MAIGYIVVHVYFDHAKEHEQPTQYFSQSKGVGSNQAIT